jgi:hypothetical protein
VNKKEQLEKGLEEEEKKQSIFVGMITVTFFKL